MDEDVDENWTMLEVAGKGYTALDVEYEMV